MLVNVGLLSGVWVQVVTPAIETSWLHSYRVVQIHHQIIPYMLAWFPDNGPFPYDNYIDHREKINFINHVMHKLNMANNVPKYVGQ
jgi:hypothetical protein